MWGVDSQPFSAGDTKAELSALLNRRCARAHQSVLRARHLVRARVIRVRIGAGVRVRVRVRVRVMVRVRVRVTVTVTVRVTVRVSV